MAVVVVAAALGLAAYLPRKGGVQELPAKETA